MSNCQQAVILVGGKGTRLGNLTSKIPKPLLNVGKKPFLSYLIESIVRQGFTDILLLAGYHAAIVQKFVDQYSSSDFNIRCVIESQPMGTGGALQHAKYFLSDNFILLNGDTLFDINLNDFVLSFSKRASVGVALRRVADTSRYGRVVLDGDRITSVQEKGASGEGLINAGIYYLNRHIIDLLPSGASSLENDLFPELLAQHSLYGREFSGVFIDIGIPSDFSLAQKIVPSNQVRPAVFFDRDGVLNKDVNYAFHSEQIEWIPGAKRTIKEFNDAGYYVFVVTNQSGIARGLYCEDDVNTLHAWMQEELRMVGAHVDRFYFCPHHPDFNGSCNCRKPASGMLLQAIHEWSIIVENSILIGDHRSDIEAAKSVSVKGYLFSDSNLFDFVVAHKLLR